MNLKSLSSPPNPGKVIKFHKKCGRSIKISDSFAVANRLEQSEPNGYVFSDRAILPGEIVLLRACGKIPTKFTEPLKIGLTIRDPSTLKTEKLCRLEKEFGSWIIPVFDFNTFSGTKHPLIHLCVLADNQDSTSMRLHQGVDGTNKVMVDMLCSSAKQFWVVLYMPASAPSMKFVDFSDARIKRLHNSLQKWHSLIQSSSCSKPKPKTFFAQILTFLSRLFRGIWPAKRNFSFDSSPLCLLQKDCSCQQQLPSENMYEECTECIICYENQCALVNLPCGHICFCMSCSQKFPQDSECPICRKGIAKTIRFYYV